MLKSSTIAPVNDHSTKIPPPPLLVWLILLAMLALTARVWNQARKSVDASAEIVFQQHVERTTRAVQERMYKYETALLGGIGLFKSVDHVSRKEWQTYVASLKLSERAPGIQGMGFAKHIQPADLDRHILQIRAEGFADYTVTPPGPRPEYTSVIYIEPFNSRNKQAFGFDMLSEPIRNKAMTQARDSGTTAVSGLVKLKQETDTDIQSGFLMYLPLYQNNAKLDSAEQRAQALLGYVYAAFRMNDLMAGILGNEEHLLETDLEIYDGETISRATLMYDADNIMHGKNENKHRLLNVVQPILIAGHVWTLSITSTPLFEARIDHAKPMIIFMAGMIISLLFFAVAWSLATHRTRAQQLAERMTSEVSRQVALNHAIVDDAADGIITIDETGTVMSFNAAAVQIFGYSLDEVMGKNIKMLMPEPDQSAHDGYLASYLTSGHKKIIGIDREVLGLRRNGQLFPMDLAVSEVAQGEGVRLFAGIVRDISARKQAEEEIVALKERMRMGQLFANIGTWEWNIQSGELFWTERIAALFGYAEGKLETSYDNFLAAIHPDDRPLVVAAISASIERNIPYDIEHRVVWPDGTVRWLQERGAAVRDTQGKAVTMLGVVQDIDDRRRAEEAIRQLHTDLNNQKFAMDQHAIVSIFDLKGNITYANDLFCKISGYSRAELMGQHHRIVNSGFHPPEFISELWRTISKGDVWSGALKNRKKDGGYYWTDATIVPLMGADGRPQQYIGIRTDISELKRVDQMKSEFISTVSHELRTPLTSIRGSLGLIDGGVAGEVSKAVKNLVGIANNNCERLIRLINDILDSEKIESGKMSLDLQVVDIRQLVQQTLVANEGFAGQHRVKVRLQAPDASLQVRIDSDRMTQVLTNLLSNAVKFSPPEGVVEVKVLRVAQQVRVEVADHGPGIPEDFRGRIFQKFSQADSSDTRQKGGTGLGLNISKALIEKMGGQIGFSSEAGAGTTFFFELPEWQNPAAPLQAAPTQAVVSRPRILVCDADVDVASLKSDKPRILHVEDDSDVQHVVAAIAQDFADFEFAATLNEARARLRESRFDLVLLDLGLGKDSGWDLFEDIDALDPPPVIVFSASDVDPAEGKQAKAVLVKARTSNTELLNTIRRVLHIPGDPGDPGPTRPQPLN